MDLGALRSLLDQVIEEVTDRVVERFEEVLDSRARLYSTEEISAMIGWDLDRLQSAIRRDADWPLPVQRPSGHGWVYGEILRHLRAQGKLGRLRRRRTP